MFEVVLLVSLLAGARPGFEQDEERPIVSRCGRSFSAACAGGSVIALSLLGFALNGWIGLVAVAVIVGLCPPLLVHAHYLKEDTALVLGFALTALAGHNFVQRCREEGPRRWRYVRPALFLGAAAGIAVSSKYLGAGQLSGRWDLSS